MIRLELQILFSHDLNPYSDLTYGQQVAVFCLPRLPDPYASEEQNARRETERTASILFDPLLNDYFKVSKFVAGKPRILDVFFPMRAA